MRRQLVARLGQSVVVIFIVTTISFFVIRLAPGDPFSYESSKITPALREQLRAQRGYDRPLGEQYVNYLARVAQGDLGWSVAGQEPVSKALGRAVPRTILLAGISLLLSFGLGVLIGVMQAVRRGQWFDRISSSALVFFYSLPDFWGAMMILLIFAYWWPVLPAAGIIDPVMHDYMAPWRRIGDRLEHLVLPVLSLTILSLAGVARFQRAAMLEVLPSDYVRTARAKGLTEREIIWRHALRNALTPMVTILGLMLPAFLGGALFIEQVFAFPGMGFLAAKAIEGRDYDVVTATVIVGAILVVVGNLLADLLHMAIDPRVRE